MITGHLRGHEIYLKDNEWFYFDNNEPTVKNERPCGHCGLENTNEGHDGCLGTLKNVINACCGHGNKNDAYVMFEDNTIIRGNEAIKFQEKNKNNAQLTFKKELST